MKHASGESCHALPWHLAASVFTLVSLSNICGAGSLSQGKELLDAGNCKDATAAFVAAKASGTHGERAEAAAFVLRALRMQGNHAAVLEQVDACLKTAEGTTFEGECHLEFAKSVQYNLKNANLAYGIYNDILKSYSANVFAGSGAALQRGLIELESLQLPAKAKASFEHVIASYPSSPFVDDSWVGKAKTGVSLKDLAAIDDAAKALDAMGASPAMRQKVRFERGEYMMKVKVSRYEAVEEYLKAANEYQAAGNTEAKAMAKVRAADLVPGGDFRKAIVLYQEAIDENPRPGKINEWAKLHQAIYHYQMDEVAEAKAIFAALLAAKPTAKIDPQARKYLKGIEDPESPESLLITYDRAIRFKQTEAGLDETFVDFQRVIEKIEGPQLRGFLSNSAESAEERAQMKYRLCFAKFFSGLGGEALELANEILAEYNPQGVTKWECLYMRAFLIGRAGNWREAAKLWREFIDSRPDINFITQAYREYARSLEFSGDTLGAALAFEELRLIYPHHKDAERAQQEMSAVIRIHPEVKEGFDSQHAALRAKCEKERKTIANRPPAQSPLDQEAVISMANQSVSTGGAE